MIDAKLVNCLMASTTHLLAFKGEIFSNPTLYRSTGEALQYLCIICPDISFCVNNLSQFLHKQIELH
jgi:hypothetical protein